jgi:membrane protein
VEVTWNAPTDNGNREFGTWATVMGLATILIAITGVSGEMQSALNKVLTISAALSGLTTFLHGVFPLLELALRNFDFVVSLILVAAMFAAMYKVLPDAAIAWRDVVVGALVATVLFGAGKYGIALYIGNSNIASSFGAAGALIVLLLWIFYSSQILLLGAEFTRAWAHVCGSHKVGMSQKPELLENT